MKSYYASITTIMFVQEKKDYNQTIVAVREYVN